MFTLSGWYCWQWWEVLRRIAARWWVPARPFFTRNRPAWRAYSGGRQRFGVSSSIFRVGGNFGSSLGPLLAAVDIAPYGKGNVAVCAGRAVGDQVLAQISRW